MWATQIACFSLTRKLTRRDAPCAGRRHRLHCAPGIRYRDAMHDARHLRLALVQMNSTVGALEDNSRKIIDALRFARGRGADIVAFPELVLAGYPPEDLLHAPRFLHACRRQLDRHGHVARLPRQHVAE